MTEKTSPCLYCQYLSEEKDACMFYIHMDIPFVEPIWFRDEEEEFDTEPNYPDSCWPLNETRHMIEEHLDNVDELLREADVTLDEIRGAWMRVALARQWIEILERSLENKNKEAIK